MMTRDEFIDQLFDECPDEIDSGDVPAIMKYLDKHREDVDRRDLEQIFFSLFTKILDKRDIEEYRYSFGLHLYLGLCMKSGISDIIVDSGFENGDRYRLGSNNWLFGNELENYKFNKIILKIETLTDCSCKELVIEDIQGRNLHLYGVTADVVIINTSVSSITMESCSGIIFEENVENLMEKVTLDHPDNLKKIVLPSIEGCQIPKWMFTINKKDLIIYKELGQKIRIYSIYKEWAKEHVKSI